MDFKIRIASRNILVHSIYSSLYYDCCGFLEESVTPEFEISMDENLILKEREWLNQSGDFYSVQSAEVFLFQKILAEKLLDYNTFLMHGAVIAVKNKAYMFVAPSGTGKSTHIEKWIRNVRGAFVVNGDKPLVLLKQEKAFACGTPWNGKERRGNNSIVPLCSIVFLERNNDNYIETMPFKAAFPLLMDQTYQPSNETKMRKKLKLLYELKDCVSFYKFYVNNFKEDAFSVSFETLTKEE